MFQKAQSVENMESELNGSKIAYGFIKRWLHIIRWSKGWGKIVTVAGLQEGPVSMTFHIRLYA